MTMTALRQHHRAPVLRPKADIAERDWDARFVPKADIPRYLD
jgi:hypothetical protein